MTDTLTRLGRSGLPEHARLETFEAPAGLESVRLRSDEVTAVCPVTGQPDWYVVTITHDRSRRCLESKALKEYLQSFRNEGLFCEALAARIAHDVAAVLGTLVEVTVEQKPRGGISIEAMAHARAEL